MSSTPLTHGSSAAPLRLEAVSKVFCRQQNLACQYAFSDILTGNWDRVGNPRRLEIPALSDVSFEVSPGRPLMVVGVPGAGKSVLAAIITGQQVADRGVVERRGSVGSVSPGKFGQSPFMRVGEYARLLAVLQGVQAAQVPAFCKQVLEWTGLEGAEGELLVDVPQSMTAPFALVSAALADRDIYLFDDYKAADDTDLGRRLASRISQIAESKTCIFLGRLPQPFEVGADYLLLHAGRVLFRGAETEGFKVCERFVRLAQEGRTRRLWNASTSQSPEPQLHVARLLVDEIHVRVTRAEPSPDAALAAIAARGDSLIIGPCLNDMSWEVLYWLPFLRWVGQHVALPGKLAISLRGLESWYRDIAVRFAAVSELTDWRAYRHLRDDGGRRFNKDKQFRVTPLDVRLLEVGASMAGIENPAVVHPSQLLHMLDLVEKGKVDRTEVSARAIYRRLPAPSATRPGLPLEYVAVSIRETKRQGHVREYSSHLVTLVRELSRRLPVVVIIDGHYCPLLEDGGRGLHFADVSDTKDVPRAEARVRIIAHARAMVSFRERDHVSLAPFFGVPALCIDCGDFSSSTLPLAASELRTPFLFTNLHEASSTDAGKWLDGQLQQASTAGAASRTT